jgi:hypothetical protein
VSESSRRRPALLWAGAGLAVAVAAIGFFAVRGGGGSGAPSNAIAEAAEVTEHEPGGHLDFHSIVSRPRALKPTVWTGAMVFDRTDASKGVVRALSPDVASPTAVQVIADGDSYYSRSNEDALLQKERKWLGFGNAVGEESNQGDFVGADAARDLKALTEATDVVAAGTGRVGGVETARYGGRAPGLGRVEVWIDGSDRVRRLRVVGSKIKVGRTPAVSAMTVDFFDFGAVPAIKLPTRREVLSVSEFEKAELEMQGY